VALRTNQSTVESCSFLSFLFWPFYPLPFFELRFLIIPLVPLIFFIRILGCNSLCSCYTTGLSPDLFDKFDVRLEPTLCMFVLLLELYNTKDLLHFSTFVSNVNVITITRLTRRVPIVEQELLTLPEHLSSSQL